MSDLVERVAFECFAAWVNHPDKEMSRAAWERNDPISRNAWLRVATAALSAHASTRADVVGECARVEHTPTDNINLQTNIDDVSLQELGEMARRLDLASIASCGCNVKTHWPQHHSMTCLYRVLQDAHSMIARLIEMRRSAIRALASAEATQTGKVREPHKPCPVCGSGDWSCGH